MNFNLPLKTNLVIICIEYIIKHRLKRSYKKPTLRIAHSKLWDNKQKR